MKTRFGCHYHLISEPIVFGRKCVKMFNWVKVNDGRAGDSEIEAWHCTTLLYHIYHSCESQSTTRMYHTWHCTTLL